MLLDPAIHEQFQSEYKSKLPNGDANGRYFDGDTTTCKSFSGYYALNLTNWYSVKAVSVYINLIFR